VFQFEVSSMFHYNDWCILINNKSLGYFLTYSLWLGITYWARFWGFRSHYTELWIFKRLILAPNKIFKIRCELWYVAWSKKLSRQTQTTTKKVYISPTWGNTALESIVTKFGNSLQLTYVINRSHFGVDWWVVSALEGVKFALSHRNNKWSIPLQRYRCKHVIQLKILRPHKNALN